MMAESGSSIAAEVEAFAALFGLRPEGARRIASGSERRNYALALPGGGRAFLRIHPPGDGDSALFELRLTEHLASRGVLTPVPLPLAPPATGRIGSHEGRCAVLLPWIEGDLLRARAVGVEHARRVGAALARCHVAAASFPHDGAPRFGAADLAHMLDSGAGHAGDPASAGAARSLAARLAAWRREGPLVETGLVHGDLFRDNVLWRGPEIAAVLDFEAASRGSLAWDLMITVLAWCFGDDLDLARARALIRAYTAVRPLSSDDRRDLHRAARLAALRFAITRLVCFGTDPSGVYHRDYRRFVARLDAVEHIGEAAWPAAMGCEAPVAV